MAEHSIIRIALIGKAGTGKSSCANTILGLQEGANDAFKTGANAEGVTSKIKVKSAVRRGVNITVADTPGMFGPEQSSGYFFVREMVRVCSVLAPGPHVFAIVVTAGRFHDEDSKAINKLKDIYGQALLKYGIIIITRKAEIEKNQTLQEWVNGNRLLKKIVEEFGNRYVGFENDSRDPAQVNALLENIKSIMSLNGEEGNVCIIGNCQDLEKEYQEEERKFEAEKAKEWRNLQSSLTEWADEDLYEIQDIFQKLLQIRMAMKVTLKKWIYTRNKTIAILDLLDSNNTKSTVGKVATGAVGIVGGTATAGVGIGAFIFTGGASSAMVAAGVGAVATSVLTLASAFKAYDLHAEANNPNLQDFLRCGNADAINSRALLDELKSLKVRLERLLEPIKENYSQDQLQVLQSSPFTGLLKQVTFNTNASIGNIAVTPILNEMRIGTSAAVPQASTPTDISVNLEHVMTSRGRQFVKYVECLMGELTQDIKEKTKLIASLFDILAD